MGTTTDKRRFGGVEKVYGPFAAESFKKAHVTVVGMGGVGSWVVEALARTGVGRLTLVDGDVSEESNTNRQCHALDGSYGRGKALLMAERVRLINPECEVEALDEMLEPSSIGDQLSAPDALVDAIDSVRAKAALLAWTKASGVFTLTSGGGAGRVDPGLIRADDVARVRDDPLIAAVRRILRAEYGFPRGSARESSKPFGITAVYSCEPVRRLSPYEAAMLPEGFGLGAAVAVTASFGLRLASLALAGIAARARQEMEINS